MNNESFNKDLSDHGAVAYDDSMKGTARDLPDVDLSDHGAVAYNDSMHGPARDLPDVDLSDHGAVAYASKQATWGTSDEELAKQINILMRASYYDNLDQIIPLLSSDSLAKIVGYRYRQVANMLDTNGRGLSQEDKVRLGEALFMDFSLINSAITLNPNSLTPIFNPSLYVGSQELTDIFGVLSQYQQDLSKSELDIPLINGSNGQPVMDAEGKNLTSKDALDLLMAKNNTYSR